MLDSTWLDEASCESLRKSWEWFWVSTWCGTSIAGGILGGILGLLVSYGDWLTIPTVALFGLMWGVVLHVALFKWMFFICWSPTILAGIVGGLSGCLTPVFPVAAPMGAAGAVIAAKKFLATNCADPMHEERWMFEEFVEQRKVSYSLSDLFSRTTAIAALIVVWKSLLM